MINQLQNLKMPNQPFIKPALIRPESGKNDPLQAVAILARFSAKYQGGNQVKQEEAARIAVNLLNEGMPAVKAIELAVLKVMQRH